MISLLLSVVPLAIGAAISPTLVALQLLVLTGATKPVARAWALAGGAALVLAGFSVLGLTVLSHLHHAERRHHSVTDGVVLFVAAALLLALAVRSIVRRPTADEAHSSRTAARLANAPTLGFVGVGAIGMVVNFSTLVLFLAALHEITRSSVALAEQGVAFAVLFVITLLPVLVPVGLVSALGSRADPALATARDFVARHTRQIGIAVEIVFACYLVLKGIGELA